MQVRLFYGLAFATFTGVFGLHRVYMGKYLTGLLYFLTGGLFFIGVRRVLIDAIHDRR